MTTTGGGCHHGMDEIVSRAIMDWIFNHQPGTLSLAVMNKGLQHRCVIEFGKIRGNRGTLKIEKS